MRLLDIHSHVNFRAFEADADVVIQDSLLSGVGMCLVGTQLPTSRRAVALAEHYAPESIWAVVGQHPIHTGRHVFDKAGFLSLAKHPRVVAIGECGLDYFRMGSTYDDPNEDHPASGQDDGPMPVKTLSPEEHKRLQREIFVQQIAIAKEVGKPLMVHCRDAYADVAQVLQEQGSPPFDIHCFTGTWEDAQPLLALGGFLSFTGILTFPKSERIQEVVKNMPLDRLMIETDCPYLAPVPFRGQRNLPKYVEFVARKVAELRVTSFEKIADATVTNAQQFFRLGQG